jgi:drug/metabolite transporter (DMT)-like permease
MTDYRRNLLQIHLAVLLFGFSGLFARFVPLPAWILCWGRVFFASLSLLALFLLRGEGLRTKSPGQTRLALAAGLVLALHWSAFFRSIQVSSVAVGTLTFATFPLFVALLEPPLFGERLRPADLGTSLALLAGVAIMVPGADLGNATTRGILWGMLGSLTFALLSLINRRLTRDNRGTLIAFYEQAAAALVLTPPLLLRGILPGPRDLLLLVLMGVVFTALAHSLFIEGIKRVKVRTAGIVSGLESVYAILAALLILGEVPPLREILGGAVVLGAATVSTLLSASEERASPGEVPGKG